MHSPATNVSSPVLAGLAYTLASAVFMSGLGVTTQLAFDAGASVGTLLSGRFLVAAAVLWPLVLLIAPGRLGRRQVAAGLLLGAGYSAHAWLFSASLARLDAGLVDLLLFTYPALVMLGAVALRRERWSARGAIALGTAMAGTSLVLAGGIGTIDTLGVGLALGSALAYAAYILISAGQLERTDPFLLTALVTTGAAVTLTAAGLARGDVSLDADPSLLGSIALVGLVAVAGMSTFVAGIGRLGASRASIVSAVQPALTPLVGFAVFADRLGPPQVLGAVLVVAGVVILEARCTASSLFSWLPRGDRARPARAAGTNDLPCFGT
jgi:drug/metabolite transporter (DMT)-like permease